MPRGHDITNQRFGRLTAIKPLYPHKGHMLWLCKCDCGNEKEVQRYRLLQGLVMSCGCMWKDSARSAGRTRFIDLTGKQFDNLTVIKQSGKAGRDILWECLCSCGQTVIVRGKDLKSGNTQSCGCLQREKAQEQGKKHVDNLLDAMVEDTNLAQLNSKPTKRSKSGIRGVFWNKYDQRWTAILMFQGKRHYLGSFDSKDEAAMARAEAEERYFDPILKKYGRKTTDEQEP